MNYNKYFSQFVGPIEPFLSDYPKSVLINVFDEIGLNLSVVFDKNGLSKSEMIRTNINSLLDTNNKYKAILFLYDYIIEKWDHKYNSDSDLKNIEKRRKLLIRKFNEFAEGTHLEVVDQNLIADTLEWLSKYPSAKIQLEKANELYEDGSNREVLDNCRLSMENLMKDLLKNNKSLENQKIEKEVLPELSKAGVSKELLGFIKQIFEKLRLYQNNQVKHNNSYSEIEVEFVMEITMSTMKILIRSFE